jgi:hypothetical protein
MERPERQAKPPPWAMQGGANSRSGRSITVAVPGLALSRAQISNSRNRFAAWGVTVKERPVTCSRGSARSAGAKFLPPITSAPIVPQRRRNRPRHRRNLRPPPRRRRQPLRRNRRLPKPSTSARIAVSRNVRRAVSVRTAVRRCPSLSSLLRRRPTLRLRLPHHRHLRRHHLLLPHRHHPRWRSPRPRPHPSFGDSPRMLCLAGQCRPG